MSAEFFKSFDKADIGSAGNDSASDGLLALRYVGNEMSTAERADFEVLLAESQSARDAVVDAVQLFAAVPLAFNESATEGSIRTSDPAESMLAPTAVLQRLVRLPQSSRRQSWHLWRGAAWAAIGAAACLLAVACINSFQHSGNSDKAGSNLQNDLLGSNGSSGQASGELALQWTNLAPQTDLLATESVTERSDLQLGSDQSPAADTDESVVDSDGTTDELSAPNWLLAAVSPPGTPLLASPDSQDSPATE